MNQASDELRPVREGRTLVCERIAGTGLSRERILLRAVKVLSQAFSVNLQYDWETKEPVALTESGISKWLTMLEQRYQSGLEGVEGLLDHPSKATLALSWSSFPKRRPEKEILKCTIPHHILLEPLLDAFTQINPEFDAYYSYTYHLTLRNLHGRAMRKYEKKLAKTPPERHQNFLKPEPYEGVTDDLPPLLVQDEFDRVRVPEGVYWVNYWSPLQVETVGISKIRATSWARLIELPSGGVVFAITEEPLDVTNSSHMNKLGEVVDYLNLRELQEHYRI